MLTSFFLGDFGQGQEPIATFGLSRRLETPSTETLKTFRKRVLVAGLRDPRP